MIAPSAQTCAVHPARPGFALCMSCKQVVCQECATTWDGINYCRACLAKRRGLERSASPWRKAVSATTMVAALLALLLCTVRFMAWAVALMSSWL
jgi:hypothetical protein